MTHETGFTGAPEIVRWGQPPQDTEKRSSCENVRANPFTFLGCTFWQGTPVDSAAPPTCLKFSAQ